MMKVYIHNRRSGKRNEMGLAVQTNRGRDLYQSHVNIRKEFENKFDKTLYAIEWGIKKFRTMSQNGDFSEVEKVKLYISSPTIYGWLKSGECPSNYIDVFSSIQMEMALTVNDIELVCSKDTEVNYRIKEKDGNSVASLLREFRD